MHVGEAIGRRDDLDGEVWRARPVRGGDAPFGNARLRDERHVGSPDEVRGPLQNEAGLRGAANAEIVRLGELVEQTADAHGHGGVPAARRVHSDQLSPDELAAAAVTAPVNVELGVGALEETITVSGQSPVIDVQRVQELTVVTNDVLNALPMSKDWGAIGALTVGVAPESQDVGGVRDSYMPYLAAHGGDTRDGMRQMDGLTMGNLSCGYSCTTLNANDAQTEELSYEIGAVSADIAVGGVRVNIIPKEGGNSFSGSTFGNFSNSGLQGDNLSQDLLDAGLRTPDVVSSIWDSSVDLGGPIVRNKLWFHGAYRNWGLKLLPANTFYDTDPNDFASRRTCRGRASTSSTTRARASG